MSWTSDHKSFVVLKKSIFHSLKSTHLQIDHDQPTDAKRTDRSQKLEIWSTLKTSSNEGNIEKILLWRNQIL
ncbi:hypothetical protein Q7C36_007451 [Tachysurus vachellii]|uniref:Uncharacterized protein n=1 Tax=Tachysurus vachellii TaxID=175792 RepID=A0AA88NA68_TACVA|nr:hypothetical protein Q7C36_007451 [Tachysurus vachellii]